MPETEFENSKNNLAIAFPRQFYEILCQVIKPRTQGDRTCFWKVCLWADKKVRRRETDAKFYDQIIDYAREASGPDAKNPAAVFMSILKKEQNYPD